MKTEGSADGWQWQAVAGAMRPPQRDSSLPGFEGGFRIGDNARKAALTGGSTALDKPQAMSLAVSGTYRAIDIPSNGAVVIPTGDKTRYNGAAMAADIFLPVIASSDGKDTTNNLVIGGEYTFGSGYGDEFGSYTGGQASPIGSGSSSTLQDKNTNLDGGIGGYDAAGQFHLIHLASFQLYAQYHFSTMTWVSLGYGDLRSNNMNLLVLPNANTTEAGNVPYTKSEDAYANVMHNLTKNIRVAAEWAYYQTGYADGLQAHNYRYQLSSWFFF
jgi:hypothetical protein